MFFFSSFSSTYRRRIYWVIPRSPKGVQSNRKSSSAVLYTLLHFFRGILVGFSTLIFLTDLRLLVDSQVDIPSSLARNLDDSYILQLEIRSILSYPTIAESRYYGHQMTVPMVFVITRVNCIYINFCRPKAARLF